MAREQQQLGPAAATPGLLPGEAAAPRPNYSQDKLLLLRCQLVLLPLPGTSFEPPAPCAACSALPVRYELFYSTNCGVKYENGSKTRPDLLGIVQGCSYP